MVARRESARCSRGSRGSRSGGGRPGTRRSGRRCLRCRARCRDRPCRGSSDQPAMAARSGKRRRPGNSHRAVGRPCTDSVRSRDADRIRGRPGDGIFGWGIVFAAAVPLFTGRKWRLGWAAGGWLAVVGGLAVAALAGESDFLAGAGVEVFLVPVAFGLALAVSMAPLAFEEDVVRSDFGMRQILSFAAVAALMLGLLPQLVASTQGRWYLPDGDFDRALSGVDPSDDFRALLDRGSRRAAAVGLEAGLGAGSESRHVRGTRSDHVAALAPRRRFVGRGHLECTHGRAGGSHRTSGSWHFAHGHPLRRRGRPPGSRTLRPRRSTHARRRGRCPRRAARPAAHPCGRPA